MRSRKQNFWPFYSKENNSFQKFYTPNISLVFSIVLSSEQLLWFRLLKPFCQATKSYPLISVFSNPLFKWSLEFILWGMKIYKSKVFFVLFWLFESLLIPFSFFYIMNAIKKLTENENMSEKSFVYLSVFHVEYISKTMYRKPINYNYYWFEILWKFERSGNKIYSNMQNVFAK